MRRHPILSIQSPSRPVLPSVQLFVLSNDTTESPWILFRVARSASPAAVNAAMSVADCMRSGPARESPRCSMVRDDASGIWPPPTATLWAPRTDLYISVRHVRVMCVRAHARRCDEKGPGARTRTTHTC